MSRSSRQSKILDIICNKEIETQDELVSELFRNGYDVTQATISRDIKELGLFKTLSANNVYKYATSRSASQKISSNLLNLFREVVFSVVTAENLVVLRVVDGGSLVVENILEQLNLELSLGIVGSGNTVLVVTKNAEDATKLSAKLTEFI
ncbi:MAG: arginine repressor [Clostridia bacterium]